MENKVIWHKTSEKPISHLGVPINLWDSNLNKSFLAKRLGQASVVLEDGKYIEYIDIRKEFSHWSYCDQTLELRPSFNED